MSASLSPSSHHSTLPENQLAGSSKGATAAGASTDGTTWTIQGPPDVLQAAVLIAKAENQGYRRVHEPPTASTFQWQQVLTDIGEVKAGQWLVKEDAEYFVTRFDNGAAIVRYKVLDSAHPLPTRIAEPPREEVEQWSLPQNESILVNVFTAVDGVLHGGGSRVVLWDAHHGCLWPHAAYIVGFQHNGLVRVRTLVHGAYIRPHDADLVEQLQSTPWASDIRLVPVAAVKPHISQRLVATRVGEQVADLQGNVCGRVVDVQTDEAWTAVTREQSTSNRRSHAASELQRHFAVGERVKIVAGPFRGLQGVVSRRMIMGGSTLKSIGGFGAVEILLEDTYLKRAAQDRIRIAAVYGQIRGVDRLLSQPPWRTPESTYNALWLLQAGLLYKRVDVQIDSVLEGTLTGEEAARRELTGYIELQRTLVVDDLWATIRVRMDVGASYRAIAIGTPPQTLTVVFDTGSTTLEVASTLCGTACSNQVQFNASESSTFIDERTTNTISFATGVGVDPVVNNDYTLTLRSSVDTVAIGDLMAPSTSFFLITNQTAKFNIDPFSGILGVGATAENVFASFVNQGLPSLFSLFLTPLAVGNAELTLGGIDTTKFSGDLIFASLPANPRSTWSLASPQIFVNGETTSVLTASRNVIFDSGTSNILFPTATANAIYAIISPNIQPYAPEPGAYGIPCADIPSLTAVISVTFTDQAGLPFNLTIPTSELNVGPFAGNETICQTLINAFDGLSLLGGSLFKHYYSVWDVGNKRMGFAAI
ncbi:Acid protease [Mycena chlorophos]|uniref:Acid protease n=1 Tax=Mycena chlorophos TaxID=658473 RepID=A0A8H6W7R0_MYCCL|nr:Acid protease [Mycena chlorophos]